jgi:hypothetical protein
MAIDKVTSASITTDAVGPTQLNEASNYAFTGTVTGASPITEADFFHTTSGQSISADTSTLVSGNWSRTTTTGFSKIGTGMSESSGIFTFPSTGIYLITFHTFWNGFGSNGASDANYCQSIIKATTDNSSYSNISADISPASSNINPKVRYVGTNSQAMFDVTSTSTHKISFYAYIESENGTLTGGSNNLTYAIFTRIGDT